LVIKSSYNQIYIQNHEDNELIILFNNDVKLRCSLILLNKTVRTFTGGFLLHYTNTFKKELRKKKHTKILLVKFIIKVLDNIYPNYNFVVKVTGLSKNFFKWLNFFKLNSKLSTNKQKYLYYVFKPALKLDSKNQKKIKSIKRRLKKKYVYSSLS